jgi:hypothetical protein
MSRQELWRLNWSIAVMDLGLSSDEFYSLTPRNLTALRDRHERKIKSNEFLFGQLTSYMVNFSMCRPDPPTKPSDFMPSYIAAKSTAESTRSSRATKKQRNTVTTSFRSLFDSVNKSKVTHK